jgi:hypothetical protein
MSTFIRPPLDFEVIREIWNKYELADNSILKVKIVLTSVRKGEVQQQQEATKPSAQSKYPFDFQVITVFLTGEHGQPDTKIYSPQELKASIIRDDISFRTVEQDWNEYLTDNNIRIKIQPLIMKVAKTSKFNSIGEPIYLVEQNITVQVKPPSTTPTP